MDALLSFYQTLGLEFVAERHGGGPLHHSAILGESVLEIYPASKPEEVDATTRLGFRIDHPARIVDVMRTNGTPIITEPKESEWGVRAVVRDPDGRAVELYA